MPGSRTSVTSAARKPGQSTDRALPADDMDDLRESVHAVTRKQDAFEQQLANLDSFLRGGFQSADKLILATAKDGWAKADKRLEEGLLGMVDQSLSKVNDIVADLQTKLQNVADASSAEARAVGVVAQKYADARFENALFIVDQSLEKINTDLTGRVSELEDALYLRQNALANIVYNWLGRDVDNPASARTKMTRPDGSVVKRGEFNPMASYSRLQVAVNPDDVPGGSFKFGVLTYSVMDKLTKAPVPDTKRLRLVGTYEQLDDLRSAVIINGPDFSSALEKAGAPVVDVYLRLDSIKLYEQDPKPLIDMVETPLKTKTGGKKK